MACNPVKALRSRGSRARYRWGSGGTVGGGAQGYEGKMARSTRTESEIYNPFSKLTSIPTTVFPGRAKECHDSADGLRAFVCESLTMTSRPSFQPLFAKNTERIKARRAKKTQRTCPTRGLARNIAQVTRSRHTLCVMQSRWENSTSFESARGAVGLRPRKRRAKEMSVTGSLVAPNPGSLELIARQVL